MDKEITKNLSFLANKLTNLESILLLLEENGIISTNEREEILLNGTSLQRNMRFLDMIKRKDCEANNNLIIEILRMTHNQHCAEKIEGITKQPRTDESVKTIVAKRQLMFEVNDNKSNNEPFSSKAPAKYTITNKNETMCKAISPQLWFGVTVSNEYYVGREKEMELLIKYWENCLAKKTLSIIAVTGLGGVGKSELAKNYAKWFYEKVEGHCIWINAETNRSVEESMRNLAENLKISLKDHLGKQRIFQEIAEKVFEKLFGEKVLFVFDNVENYELPVFKLLIYLSAKMPPTVMRPLVFTTSRFIEAKQYFGSQCNQIDLQVLTKHSAIQLFCKSLNIDESAEGNIHEIIERLCHRLYFFPLAMQQASAYINERICLYGNVLEAITNYLAKTQAKTLLDYKLPHYEVLDETSKTTLLTWRITFDKLRDPKEGGEITADIMNVISFLSSDNIPTQMVISILKRLEKVSDIRNIDNFCELIRKYSMINFSGEKSISVHRLVQEVTRIELEERGEFLSALGGVANCLKEMLVRKEIFLKDLVHVQMVWEHLRGDKAMIEEHGELLGLICQKYFDSGRYRDLLDFSIESAGFTESVVGKNSRWAMKMKYFKGKALSELGQYFESMEVLKYSYEKQKETFGEDDEDCLDTAYEVGGAYYHLRKYAEALNIHKDTLEIVERIFGKEHRRTLDIKSDIANVLYSQNKLKEAMKAYKEILEVEERVFGQEDPSTLLTKHSIALVKFNQMNYEESLTEFQEVLEIEERVLEFGHPDFLKTKYLIAVVSYHLGRHEKSLQILKEVHESRVQILGPRHPNTIDTERWIEKVELHIAVLASSFTELSSILSEIPTFVMDMFGAKDISLEDLVEIQIIWKHLIRDKEMKEENGKSLSGICTKWHNSGKHKNLLDFSSRCAELVESVSSQNNRWTLKMKFWKGVALSKLGEYSESLEMLTTIWKTQKDKFGEYDEDSLDTANQLGYVYYLLNNYEDAMEIYENILEKREVVSGKEHEDTLTLKNNIAHVFCAQNYNDEALELYTEILEVRDRMFGVEHFSTLITKHNIALVKLNQKKYEEALRDFKDVLEIRERVLLLNHPNTLATKYKIAETYYHLGRFQESLQLAKEVHEHRVHILGPLHPDTIDTEELIDQMEIEITLQRSITEF